MVSAARMGFVYFPMRAVRFSEPDPWLDPRYVPAALVGLFLMAFGLLSFWLAFDDDAVEPREEWPV